MSLLKDTLVINSFLFIENNLSGFAMSTINKLIVKKSNDLMVARYSMTVNEQRLLLACISQIPLDIPLTSEFEFILTVEQAKELLYSGKSKQNILRDMREAVSELWGRDVKLQLPNGDILQTRFVSSIVWEAEKNTIKVNFAPKILPYLSMLKGNFTRYRLNNIVQLTSFYAVRIYELIVRWSENGKYSEKEIEIDELKKILDIEEKYTQFSELKKFVINRAVRQINENTDFRVNVEFRKLKRSFKWIMFTWKRNEEAVKAEKEAQAKRKSLAKRNNAAKTKREYTEQMEAKHRQMTEVRQSQEQVEQERQAWEREERGYKASQALGLWKALSDAERLQVRETALKTVYPALRNSLQAAFETDNFKELTGRFFNDFMNALEPFKPMVSATASPTSVNRDKQLESFQMYKDGLIFEDDLLLLLPREEILQMYKDGTISRDDLLGLLKKIE